MRFVKPLDEKLLKHVFKNYEHIITVEDGCELGGFGESIISYANAKAYHNPIKIFAIKDDFITHGTIPELYDICELNNTSILAYLEQIV